MRKRLAALFQKICGFSILPRDFPAHSPYRFLDFPYARVSFDKKGGFFAVFAAPPQFPKFPYTARSLS
jgi:hypothetical protein